MDLVWNEVAIAILRSRSSEPNSQHIEWHRNLCITHVMSNWFPMKSKVFIDLIVSWLFLFRKILNEAMKNSTVIAAIFNQSLWPCIRCNNQSVSLCFRSDYNFFFVLLKASGRSVSSLVRTMWKLWLMSFYLFSCVSLSRCLRAWRQTVKVVDKNTIYLSHNGLALDLIMYLTW